MRFARLLFKNQYQIQLARLHHPSERRASKPFLDNSGCPPELAQAQHDSSRC
jgi:hypothetical protein